MDVIIRYEDGYAVTCILDTTSGNLRYFTDCHEGTKGPTP
jgi:hypothetical protein